MWDQRANKGGLDHSFLEAPFELILLLPCGLYILVRLSLRLIRKHHTNMTFSN